jgi:16S rRNA processing protein RimM
VNEELITVGKFGKTRGIHGELWVTPLTDFPDRFIGLKEIYVGNRGNWEKMAIVSSRMIGERPVLGMAGYTTPEAAARLTNRELAVPRDELVKLPKDTYYVFDLIGCGVFGEGNGTRLGEVADVESYPANDVYLIAMADGSRRILPATKQAVKSIDLKNRRMVVDTDSLLETE